MMKLNITIIFIGIMTISNYGCNEGVPKPANENAVVCANSFMRCLYEGKFDAAATIMQTDAASMDCLKKRKFNYQQKLTKEEKAKYKRASLNIKLDRTLSATESIFQVSDAMSEQNLPRLKVIKKGEDWLVDYGYSCSGNI
jgi:hypothetical protein